MPFFSIQNDEMTHAEIQYVNPKNNQTYHEYLKPLLEAVFTTLYPIPVYTEPLSKYTMCPDYHWIKTFKKKIQKYKFRNHNKVISG